MKHLRGLLCAWPWLVVLVAAIWMGSPLWQAQDVVYGRIAGDGLATPWLYDWVARTLLSGGDLSTVGDFGFRNEFQRYRDFPSALDAYLAAPTSWLLEWPMQYSGAQGWALILNGLGVAALAWAMGCRGMGIAVAGVLGASLEPVWKELWYARMNAAWPGVAALALASWLVVIQPGENGRRVWVTGVGALVAVGLGVLAAGVYPPTLLMLTPPALACWIAGVRGSWRRSVFGLVVVGIALYLAWPLLSVMLHSQRAWTFHCPAGSWVGFCQDGTIGIPPSLGGGITMFDVGPQLSGWLGIQPRQTVGSERYIALGAWGLSGLCLIRARGRAVLVAWLGAGMFLALLGQGQRRPAMAHLRGSAPLQAGHHGPRHPDGARDLGVYRSPSTRPTQHRRLQKPRSPTTRSRRGPLCRGRDSAGPRRWRRHPLHHRRGRALHGSAPICHPHPSHRSRPRSRWRHVLSRAEPRLLDRGRAQGR